MYDLMNIDFSFYTSSYRLTKSSLSLSLSVFQWVRRSNENFTNDWSETIHFVFGGKRFKRNFLLRNASTANLNGLKFIRSCGFAQLYDQTKRLTFGCCVRALMQSVFNVQSLKWEWIWLEQLPIAIKFIDFVMVFVSECAKCHTCIQECPCEIIYTLNWKCLISITIIKAI